MLDSSWNYKKNSPGKEHINTLITIDFFLIVVQFEPFSIVTLS